MTQKIGDRIKVRMPPDYEPPSRDDQRSPTHQQLLTVQDIAWLARPQVNAIAESIMKPNVFYDPAAYPPVTRWRWFRNRVTLYRSRVLDAWAVLTGRLDATDGDW